MKRIIRLLLAITISLLLTGIINGNFIVGNGVTDSEGIVIPIEPAEFDEKVSEATRSDQWIKMLVDSNGYVGKYSSLELDRDGHPHISYYDESSGYLQYAYYDGEQWHIESVDPQGNGGGAEYTSLALDTNDRPHISYYNSGLYSLKYANKIGAEWYNCTVDWNLGWGAGSNNISLDSNNYPHICYYNVSSNDLNYAYFNGSQWNYDTVDDSVGSWGQCASIVMDNNDQPHISYYCDWPDYDLKYAWNNSVNWNITTVDSQGNVGRFSSLALDNSSSPHISYYDNSNHDLKYAYWNGTNWTIETVNSQGYVGKYTSLALDSREHPHISYYDDTNDDLGYAYYDGNQWHNETVDSQGIVGTCTSLALDSYDGPHISYYDKSNRDLKYAVLDLGPPVLEQDLSGTPTTGELFSFIINASDNVGIGVVNVTYTFDEANYYNESMDYDELGGLGFQGFWLFNITIPSNSTTIRYWFTIRDNAGNKKGTVHFVKDVLDNDAPQFEADLSGTPTTGDSFNFAMNASDNIGINFTQVSYTYDMSSFQTQTMYDDGTHGDPLADDGIWTSDPIDIPPDVIAVNYSFSIWDAAGNVYNTSNISWLHQDIMDNDPPQLIEDLTKGNPTTGDTFTVSFNASDNMEIGLTSVTYYFDDEINQSSEMTSSDNGTTWSKSIDIPNDTAEMVYRFGINDSSGNGLVTNATSIDVLDNDDPQAVAGEGQTIVQYKLFTFNGSQSSDNIGILNYTWTFEYDGKNHTLNGISPNFIFEKTGKYNITLTVTDAASNSHSDNLIVTVNLTTPFAEAGPNKEIGQNNNVTFDASNSTSEVSVVNYTWTFRYKTVNQILNGKVVTFKFDNPGIYNVTLTIKDAAGNVNNDLVIITIKDTEDPVAVGIPKESDIKEGDTVHFDANASSDNVGIVDYTWTFIDNSLQTLNGKSPTYTFDKKGAYNVTLTVTDTTGNVGTTVFSVNVEEKEAVEPIKEEEPTDEGGLSTTVIAIIVIVIVLAVIIAIFIVIKKRKGEPAEEPEEAAEPEEELGEFEEGEEEEGEEEEEEPEEEEKEDMDEESDKGGKEQDEEEWAVDDDEKEEEEDEIWGDGEEEDLDESEDARRIADSSALSGRDPTGSSGLPGRDRSEEEEEEWAVDEEEKEEEEEEEPWAEYSPELTPIPSSMEGLIPGYIITNKLGSGGFATVYKANNPKGETVAIKLPKFMDETIDSSILNKFKAESDIWKKLKHRNIVKFLKGDIRPVPYMVIEYMEGGNLLNLIKTGSLPIDKVIFLIQEIMEGMAYAHRMASVHRDIKPENILFTKDGTPKIADWGIGKFMASESVSKTIGTKGTLIYSAPEQMSQEKYGAVDWSTDVYQLGVVFYEMLTGENPFKADDPIGIMHNIIEKIPVPPSSLRPGIPPEVDAVILRSLEKEKAKRFRSADTMLAKLEEGLKDREKNIRHYQSMLNRALKDGMISPEEEEMLEGFRERFGISSEEHKKIWNELDK